MLVMSQEPALLEDLTVRENVEKAVEPIRNLLKAHEDVSMKLGEDLNEAEMNKVSWPTRRELWNASLVVIFVIFSMAAFLFLFDALWTKVFELIGIRYSS